MFPFGELNISENELAIKRGDQLLTVAGALNRPFPCTRQRALCDAVKKLWAQRTQQQSERDRENEIKRRFPPARA